MSTRCFWVEPILRERLSLRRYSRSHGDCSAMPGQYGYHDAHRPLFDVDARIVSMTLGDGTVTRDIIDYGGPKNRADVPPEYAWPTNCACGYAFVEDDHWQVFGDALYQRADTGAIVTLRGAPPGAMWDAWWMHGIKGGFLFGPGEDGLVLMVKLPNGHDWCPDRRASNCTMPNDDNHRCWRRHGDPRTGPVTVDKNGPTCAAGAGSILSGDYHGFLRNGELT